MKGWIATIIPEKNVIAARTSIQDRGLDGTASVPYRPIGQKRMPHRVTGQRVCAFTGENALSRAQDWADSIAKNGDIITIRIWNPK